MAGNIAVSDNSPDWLVGRTVHWEVRDHRLLSKPDEHNLHISMEITESLGLDLTFCPLVLLA